MADGLPTDPSFDWPSVFAEGDIVRLQDGRLAVVSMVLDYAPHPPARWELLVSTVDQRGGRDGFITEPWLCLHAPEATKEAESLGLT